MSFFFIVIVLCCQCSVQLTHLLPGWMCCLLQHLASEVRSCLLLQSELQATAARVVSVGVEGEDMVRRSLDALVVALHSAAIQDMSQEGEGGCAGLEGPEMKALEAFVETTRKQVGSMLLHSCQPQHL